MKNKDFAENIRRAADEVIDAANVFLARRCSLYYSYFQSARFPNNRS